MRNMNRKFISVFGILLVQLVSVAYAPNERDFSLRMCEEVTDDNGIIRNPLLRYLNVQNLKINQY